MRFKREQIPANSTTKAFELLCVLEEIKPVARTIEKDGTLKDWCEKNGLFVEEADYKLKLFTEEDKGYSNKGIKTSEEEGSSILYISKKKTLAEDAKQAENDMNHVTLGKLLGYPSCCCEFFAKHYEEESRKRNDYAMHAIKTDLPVPFQTNIFIRCFDITLLFHFPCSMNCEDSINLSEIHLALLKKENGKYAKDVVTRLKYPVIYSETQGVHVLLGSLNKYEDIISSADTALSQQLKKGNRIENEQIFKEKDLIGEIEGTNVVFK